MMEDLEEDDDGSYKDRDTAGRIRKSDEEDEEEEDEDEVLGMDESDEDDLE